MPETITKPLVSSNESLIKSVPATVLDVIVAFTEALLRTNDLMVMLELLISKVIFLVIITVLL